MTSWPQLVPVLEDPARGVRTATVTSAGDGSLLRLDGPAFADAVSLAPAMPRALRDSLRARLSRTHPRLAADLEEQ